jgi:hypothetical protein
MMKSDHTFCLVKPKLRRTCVFAMIASLAVCAYAVTFERNGAFEGNYFGELSATAIMASCACLALRGASHFIHPCVHVR